MTPSEAEGTSASLSGVGSCCLTAETDQAYFTAKFTQTCQCGSSHSWEENFCYG